MPWNRDALLVWQDRVDPLADDATLGIHPGPPRALYEQVAARAAAGHAGA